MSDPRRLLDDPELSPLGRALIASTTEDGPSAESRRGAARKLGLAAGLIASGEALATGGMWWKLVTLLVVAGGVTVGVVSHGRHSADAPAIAPSSPGAAGSRPASAPVAPSQPAPAPVAVAPAAPPAVVVPAVPAPREELPPPRPARVSRATTARSESLPPAPPAAPAAVPPPPPPAPAPPPVVQVDARRLAAEVALIDHARAALAAHDVAGALALLDEHAKSFADGALVAEAQAVHIEALVAAHRTAEAAAEARAFLARFPHSPLVPRVRELTSIREK